MECGDDFMGSDDVGYGLTTLTRGCCEEAQGYLSARRGM